MLRHGSCCDEQVMAGDPSDGGKRLSFLFIFAVGLVAGTISGIIGTGSSIMLMPILVYQYGPKQAVPIMAIASVMANLSRILPGGARSTGAPAPVPVRHWLARHDLTIRLWQVGIGGAVIAYLT